MLGFPLPFYWLSGVKWATDLGWDFWPSHLQFYPGVYVTSVITLLTYPVSTYTAESSFSSMKRLQTPLQRTMTDERLSFLAILHMRTSYGRNWYWWHYNRVCLSVPWWRHWFTLFCRGHCTLPITLEMGKINNQLLHFPLSLFTGNVLQKTQKMAFPRP